MPLGGSPTAAWIVTIGFVVLFVLPVVYLTYLSMQREEHTASGISEANGTES
ncbi:MAG: hypothetical protein ABEH78_03745 [Haloferacaceae archaeon]